MLSGDSPAAGRDIRRIGLRIFSPFFDIRVEGHVRHSSNIGGIDPITAVAKIARNVDKVASSGLAIDTNVLETNTNIAEASINVSATQIAGPEAPSYLGDARLDGLDAGSNTANSSADGCGSQCDIVEIDFHGQEMDIDMPRARSNVARSDSDRREDECNVNDFHKYSYKEDSHRSGWT
jgi:hypothetical protein